MTPPNITYKKTAETKACLLQAGVKLFTSGAASSMTSRDVAREANVNHALIAYHFDSFPSFMERVFSLCLEELRRELQPVIDRIADITASSPREALGDNVCCAAKRLVEALNGAKGSALLAAILAYGNAAGPDVYTRFSETVTKPLFTVFVECAAKARRVEKNSVEAGVLAQLLMSQAMAFFRGAGIMREHLNWGKLERCHLDQISEIFCDSLRRLLA